MYMHVICAYIFIGGIVYNTTIEGARKDKVNFVLDLETATYIYSYIYMALYTKH